MCLENPYCQMQQRQFYVPYFSQICKLKATYYHQVNSLKKLACTFKGTNGEFKMAKIPTNVCSYLYEIQIEFYRNYLRTFFKRLLLT